MLTALKKLFGADEGSKKRRHEILDEERKEREARVRQQAEKLKENVAGEERG